MIVVLFLLVASPAPAKLDGQRAFEAAIAREGARDWSGAAADLEKLAREQPGSDYADDALFEAAVLAEERLGDPARAARLYGEVAEKYPRSRLARRARTRAEFLNSSLRTGEAPLAEYQRILSEGAHDPAAAISAMEQLLSKVPDFALADRALYWLASRLVEQGRLDEGERRFLELERRFPSSEWARRGMKSRGDLALKRGRRGEAQKLYEQLSHSSDPIARAGGVEGLAAVHSSRWRRALVIAAIFYLLAFLGAHLFVAGRRLLRLPLELAYYLPVAALFAVAGITENASIGWATGVIAGGGGIITWIVAAGTAQRLERGPIRWPERVLRSSGLLLAVVALTYVAIQATGLTDLVLETMRAGPER